MGSDPIYTVDDERVNETEGGREECRDKRKEGEVQRER
jgi:hypothetical protein